MYSGRLARPFIEKYGDQAVGAYRHFADLLRLLQMEFEINCGFTPSIINYMVIGCLFQLCSYLNPRTLLA